MHWKTWPDFRKATENFHFVIENIEKIQLNDVLDFEIGFFISLGHTDLYFPSMTLRRSSCIIALLGSIKGVAINSKKFWRVLAGAIWRS